MIQHMRFPYFHIKLKSFMMRLRFPFGSTVVILIPLFQSGNHSEDSKSVDKSDAYSSIQFDSILQ
jgi:hypothetical protein